VAQWDSGIPQVAEGENPSSFPRPGFAPPDLGKPGHRQPRGIKTLPTCLPTDFVDSKGFGWIIKNKDTI